MLAALPDAEARDIILRSDRRQLTSRTIIEPNAAMAQVQEARENGFAVALEEVLIGEIAVGAAVLDKEGRPIAAIHVVGSLGEWRQEEYVQRVALLTVGAANAISKS